MIPILLLLTKYSEDENFLIRLYLDHQRLMYFIARKYTDNPADQEEIVQSALVKIVKHVKRIREIDETRQAAYIGVLTKNTAINHVRHTSVVDKHTEPMPVDELSAISARDYLPEKFVIRLEQRELIREVLDRLRESDRILIEGKYFLQLTDTELAELLGCKPRSISMMITRAKRRAVAEMNRMVQDDEP